MYYLEIAGTAVQGSALTAELSFNGHKGLL